MNPLLSRKKEQKHYEHRKIKNLKAEVNQIMKNKILKIKKQQVKANKTNRKYLRLKSNKLKHIILRPY